jgi:hypothetical protein
MIISWTSDYPIFQAELDSAVTAMQEAIEGWLPWAAAYDTVPMRLSESAAARFIQGCNENIDIIDFQDDWSWKYPGLV